MIKKYLCVALLILAVVFSLCGCVRTQDDGKLKIVCTVFPGYDFVREIMGDLSENASISYLLESGTDIHAYKNVFSPADKISIISCDILVYVGGESDKWLEDVLKDESTNKSMAAISMFDCAEEVKKEESTEGMKGEEEETDEEEYDEHVWLSLKNAELCCNAILEALCRADSANSAVYTSNCAAYIEKLKALDTSYRETVASAKRKTVIFADRFPFRYLLDDYGIEYFAAFPGCSTETNTTMSNILTLAQKADEYGITSLITIENSAVHITDTIISLSNADNMKILVMNSLQSVTKKQVGEGISYYSVMQSNLEVLREALN